MNLTRLTELSKEINAWAQANFQVHNPPLGILEEIGECSHCVLKQSQGIRGFDNPEHFKAEFLDALCDLCVYTLHDVALKEMELEHPWTQPRDDDETFLAYLADLSSRTLREIHRDTWGQQVHSAILKTCEEFAKFRGFELWPALEETWAKVKTRDWKTNPKDAAELAL